MKYEIKEISGTKKKIEAELTAEEFDVFYAEALREFAREVELPGFRKGKAPEKMVEDKVNPADLLSEAAEHGIRHSWGRILTEAKLEAVSAPRVEIVKVAKGNPFVFNIEVEVLPEIKLPDIRNIANGVKKEEVKVEDKEVEDTLNWLQQSRAKISQKDGTAEKEDLVEIAFFSPDIKDDKDKKDRFVIGKTHYIKGMEEALLGMKAGQEKEFETVNPEDKKQKIHIKVDSIKKVELPEITDEWAKTLGNFNDVNGLKEDIKKGIREEKELSFKQQHREEVLHKILEKTSFNAPEAMVKREVDILTDNLKSRVVEELKMGFEEYLSQVKRTEDDVRNDFKKIADERVKGFLVLHQISKDEKILVEDKEIKDKIEEIINQYPDKEQARKNMDTTEMKMYIEDELKREKIFDLLGC